MLAVYSPVGTHIEWECTSNQHHPVLIPHPCLCSLDLILTVPIMAVRSAVAWRSGVGVKGFAFHLSFLGVGWRGTSSAWGVFDCATAVKDEDVGSGSASLHAVWL